MRLQGTRLGEDEKTGGGWTQKKKRRRWKPKFYGTVWKAPPDTLMVKVTISVDYVRANDLKS